MGDGSKIPPSGIRKRNHRAGFVRMPYLSKFSSMRRALVANKTSVIRFKMPADQSTNSIGNDLLHALFS